MDDYTTVEVEVLFDALEEHKDRLKHYPYEFTPEQAEATESLYEAFHLEAQYRGLIG
ncbi:hypothetical protein RGQ21_68050 [Kitasatospora aureofaciens]|nr:hypothetical protein RGQ21_68050 [Kitasatospora aureofaciens]